MASAVTIVPWSDNSASSFGTAVISLLLPSTATCPSTSRWSAAQALTRCRGDCPAARSNERRRVLPSRATTPARFSEAGVKLRRIEQTEQAREGVVARDAVAQAQERAEVVVLGAAKQSHVGAVLGATEHGTEGDQQDLVQVVAGVVGAWVVQIGKAGREG